MCFRWQGPRRITGVVGDLVCDVSNVTETNSDLVHCARLKLQRPSEEGSKVSEEMLQLAEHTEARFQILEKIQDISKDRGGIVLQVQWAGIPKKATGRGLP